MLQGIAFALGACFIWGLIFIVPMFMEGFSAIEVAMGRYASYGAISSLFFFRRRVQGLCKYPSRIWIRAIGFSLMCSFGYYTWLVLALRFCTPAVPALILGLSPLTIAFYGNWKKHECSYKSLILPSCLMLVGLIMINAPHICSGESTRQYVQGLVCTSLSLAAWTWYVVANSQFLHDNPDLCPSDWSTLIGVSTLFWVAVFGTFFGTLFADQLSIMKMTEMTPELTNFLIGCGILGLLCSWLGAFLWNQASLRLPVSLAGQLTIFETIFGAIFVYAVEQRQPPLIEIAGIAVLLTAIVYGIRIFAHKPVLDN